MSNIKKYKTGEITQILEGIYNDPIARKTIVPLFISDPGRGKTHVIRDFMNSKGVFKPPFILSQRMPFEVSGMALVDREKEFMKYYDFDFFNNLKDDDILFCDETFNANPTTLSAFLTFLEDRIMISGKKLPNIMIIAAANPQGKPVITPQINRRFVIYDIVFDAPYWKKFMLEKYKMPEIVSSKLCNLIQNEKFTSYNYCTEADFDKAVHMIINKIATPYEDELLPILNTLIENKLKEPVKLSEDKTLEVGESISWLDMIRLNKSIKLPEIKDDFETYYSIWLKEIGNTKLLLLKTIKELIGLDLKEAKELVDNVPCEIKTNLTQNDANEFRSKLEECGATISIKEFKSNNKQIENKYKILMYNDNDEVVGEIKDIEVLKTMYYFSGSDIEKINSGIKQPLPPQPPSPPLVFPQHLSFKKIINN